MGKVFIVTNPIPSTNQSPLISLNKLIQILSRVFGRVSVFGGNLEDIANKDYTQIHNIRCDRTGNKLLKLVSFLKLELILFIRILNTANQGDKAFFWIADKMLLPFWAAKLKRAPIYYFLMGNIGYEGGKSLFRSISQKIIVYMAEHAEYICVESPAVIECWHLRVKPERIKVIHLFVEASALSLYDQKENTIGMVCRLAAGKHVLESIMAFSMFLKTNAGWNLQIIGSGNLREDCENLINKLNLEQSVEMLGWVDHHKLPSIIAKWKLLLFPTDAEGLPNGLIETMLQGVPAVASHVGGIIDVIEDGINGWVLPDCSADSICKTMIHAVSSSEFLSIAKTAKRTIEQRYTFEASVNNLKAQLNEVVA
ncbi:MAG: glycosyltransferase [Negativicutes bacterium]|nr:glycosyltransferase [Negativicutes bacterium]